VGTSFFMKSRDAASAASSSSHSGPENGVSAAKHGPVSGGTTVGISPCGAMEEKEGMDAEVAPVPFDCAGGRRTAGEAEAGTMQRTVGEAMQRPGQRALLTFVAPDEGSKEISQPASPLPAGPGASAENPSSGSPPLKSDDHKCMAGL
jgi:hypothetical protein